jgi:predicted Zn-dependent protease
MRTRKTFQATWALRALAACLIGALAVSACGDKRSKAGDANAAEATPTTPETSSVATAPVVTGPVSFEDAKAAYQEKRYDEAVRLFTTYTSEKPDNVWGYYMLGLSAWKAGDREAAVKAFQLALDKDSTHVKSHLNLSRVLIEQGHAQQALAHVEAVLQLDSTSNEAFRLLGRAKGELGDTMGAVEAYRHAIVLDGRDAWSMNNLGRIYLGQGRFQDALGPLARAIEIDSTVPSFRQNFSAAVALSQQDSSGVDRCALAQAFVEQTKSWR